MRLDKIGIMFAAVVLSLACALPAFATVRVQRQRVVVQKQVVVQQVRVPRQRVVVQRVVVPHHVQQVRVQQVLVPHVQQFNAGCHNGALQFNAGGCQQFFAH